MKTMTLKDWCIVFAILLLGAVLVSIPKYFYLRKEKAPEIVYVDDGLGDLWREAEKYGTVEIKHAYLTRHEGTPYEAFISYETEHTQSQARFYGRTPEEALALAIAGLSLAPNRPVEGGGDAKN